MRICNQIIISCPEDREPFLKIVFVGRFVKFCQHFEMFEIVWNLKCKLSCVEWYWFLVSNSYFDVEIFFRNWRTVFVKQYEIVVFSEIWKSFESLNASFPVSNDIGFWSQSIALILKSSSEIKKTISRNLSNFLKRIKMLKWFEILNASFRVSNNISSWSQTIRSM